MNRMQHVFGGGRELSFTQLHMKRKMASDGIHLRTKDEKRKGNKPT